MVFSAGAWVGYALSQIPAVNTPTIEWYVHSLWETERTRIEHAHQDALRAEQQRHAQALSQRDATIHQHEAMAREVGLIYGALNPPQESNATGR